MLTSESYEKMECLNKGYKFDVTSLMENSIGNWI